MSKTIKYQIFRAKNWYLGNNMVNRIRIIFSEVIREN